MIPLLDLEAPIVPGKGLAGLPVGARVKRYGDLLFEASLQYDSPDDEPDRPVWCEFWMAPWVVRYRLGQVYGQTDAEFIAMTDALSAGDVEAALAEPPRPGDVEDTAVEIYVDIRHGRIYMLSALPAYRGTFRGIRPGTRVEEAMALEPGLAYDENLDELRLAGDEGIGFALSESDPAPEEVPSLVIEAIEVYAPRITTRGAIDP